MEREEFLKEISPALKSRPMTTQQKITDLEKRQQAISKELEALKKEMKPLSTDFIIKQWSGNSFFSVFAPNKRTGKIIAISHMIAVADYLNGDWKPNIADLKEPKYIIKYHLLLKQICTDQVSLVNASSICYFKTEELADQAIQIIGEEKIKLALM